MSNISPHYRRAAELAGLSTETGRTLAALAVACDALWDIAQFAIHVGEAPAREDYDDAESAYDNGENVALWEDGMKALKALADMGDAKAAEIFEANRELEDARDGEDEGDRTEESADV